MEIMHEITHKSEKQIQEEKRNILIAEKVRQVLKTKLLLNQKILKRENSQDSMTLDEFIKREKEITEKLDSMEKTHPERAALESEFYAFLERYADKVILNDLEIDQLLSYVKTSIARFGIPRNQEEYTSNELVKYALLLLNDSVIECYGEEDPELSKWIDLICSSSNAAFYNKTSEIYQIKGYGAYYFTISDYHKRLYSISLDGNVSINRDVDFSNMLLRDDLYLGTINLNNKRVLTILSKREGFLYPIFFDNKCASYSDELETRLKLDARAMIPLASALKYRGMSQYIEPLYDRLMIEHVAIAMNEKHYSTSELPSTTYNISLSDGEIPANELYIYKTNIGGSWKSGIMRKSRDGQEENPAIEPIANLNEVLELIGLSYLVEDSYDPRKLEYIMLSIRDGNAPSIAISEETPNVAFKKLV